MLLLLPPNLIYSRRASFSQLFQKFVQSPTQPLFGNSVTSSFATQPLRAYNFFYKIQSSLLKPMFAPNHRHQIVVCCHATRVGYPNK